MTAGRFDTRLEALSIVIEVPVPARFLQQTSRFCPSSSDAVRG
jgi:hypothetical protein